MCILTAVLALVLRFVHIRENKKLESAEQEVEGGKVAADATQERRAAGFRYIY
jgi:HAMP domain-containing protein